jgi:hypothetical protein
MADKILELKVGSVDVANIDEYNALRNKLAFWRKRLDTATSTVFQNVEYFHVGAYGTDSSEGRNMLILADNRSDEDKLLKQAVIDTLTMKIIEQINDKIKKINQLVK